MSDNTENKQENTSDVKDEKATTNQTDPQAQGYTILTGKKLALLFSALLLCIFLIALDQTILATAIPRIASDFNQFSSQGWVATAFILTQTAFMLFFSQLLRIFIAKDILMIAVFIFELGSLICGVSPSLTCLIFGRALAGVGASALFVSMVQIMVQVTKLEDRPKFMGIFMSVFGISSIIGPLIGGAFTDHSTWRWCFYINLPIGGLGIIVVFFTLKRTPPLGSLPEERTWGNLWHKAVYNIDWIGTALVLAAVTTLVLGFQWGGNTKSWDDGSVIASLVVSGVLFIVFGAWEFYMGDKALVPLKIFKSFSIYCIVTFAFFARFAMFLFIYYIPIYYQAAKGHSATKSGIDLLPMLLAQILTGIIVGQLISRTGYYYPFLPVGPSLIAIGAGLLYLVNPNIENSKIIGFEIMIGVGVGIMMVATMICMQAEFKETPKLIAQANGISSFIQFLGGTIGLSVAQCTFSSELGINIAKYAPEAPVEIVRDNPIEIKNAIPEDLYPSVILALTRSLRIVFILGVPAGGCALLAALFIKNIYVKEDKKPNDEEKNNKEDVKPDQESDSKEKL